MVVVLVGSIAATACGGGAGDESTEVRVRSATYEFRGQSYGSITELEAALDAVPEQAISISVSNCADESWTVDLVRVIGVRQTNVAFSTFEEVCQ
jgi:hypothetical protein